MKLDLIEKKSILLKFTGNIHKKNPPKNVRFGQ